MKKLLQMLAAVVLALGLMSGVASADHSISNTGPGSNNEIIEEHRTDIECDNEVDIEIDNNNNQEAESGGAEVEGNTNGEDASTGDASNENRTSTGVEVDGGCLGGEKKQPNQPGGGNGGGPVNGGQNGGGNGGQQPDGGSGGVVSGAVTTAPGGVAVLPETGANDVLVGTAGVVGSLSVLAVLASAATALYRRRVLNS